MVKEPQTQATALWKERYRAIRLWQVQLARQMPSHGIVVTAASGTGQIYAWDMLSGALRQLTHRRKGVFSGFLSPNGSHVYYLRDEAGSETGHYVRIPWEGGEEQDIMPSMPPYAAIYQCAVSDNGAMFAFIPTEANGFPLYCLDLSTNSTMSAPRELYRSPKLIDDVALSYNAEMVVVATTEHSQARQYSLVAIDTTTGQQMGELSDLPLGSVRAVMFSPLPGDTRLLCTANCSGYSRPLIWDPRSAERRNVPLGELTGEVEPRRQQANDQICQISPEKTLPELATTPLMLGTLVLTYQGKSSKDLPQVGAANLPQHIIEHYIARVFEYKGKNLPHSKQQTMSWLSWLAMQMKKHNQKMFYLEQLQMDWYRQLRFCRFPFSVLVGIVLGLFIWFGYGLFYASHLGVISGIIDGLWVGCCVALLYIFINGFLLDWLEESKRSNQMNSNSRFRWKHHFLFGFLTNRFGYGLTFGIIIGPLIGIPLGIASGVTIGVSYGLLNIGILTLNAVLYGHLEKEIHPAEVVKVISIIKETQQLAPVPECSP